MDSALTPTKKLFLLVNSLQKLSPAECKCPAVFYRLGSSDFGELKEESRDL